MQRVDLRPRERCQVFSLERSRFRVPDDQYAACRRHVDNPAGVDVQARVSHHLNLIGCRYGVGTLAGNPEKPSPMRNPHGSVGRRLERLHDNSRKPPRSGELPESLAIEAEHATP